MKSSPKTTKKKIKKEVLKTSDVLHPGSGDFVHVTYLNFEPYPLLPTYSFIKGDKEMRYKLVKLHPKEEKDKKWPYKLELIK